MDIPHCSTRFVIIPLIQLLLVAVLIFFIVYSITHITAQHKTRSGQEWPKKRRISWEPPLSSLQGWIEMLKEQGLSGETVSELQKDVDRLKLVSDRFSKIGSIPQLEKSDLVFQITQMLDYMRRRTTSKVQFQF